MEEKLKLGFTGEYEHNLDDKGRVSLPTKIRKYIEDHTTVAEAAGRVVLSKSSNRDCLELFMVEDWNRMVSSHIQGMSIKNNTVEDPVMDTGRNTDIVAIDKAGRIMINAKLQELASMEKGVVFVGAIDRVQVWAGSKLKEYDKGRKKWSSKQKQKK